MKRTLSSFCIAIFLTFFFYSCKKDNGGSGTVPPVGGTTTAGPLFTAVKNMMSGSCAVAGCHAGASPASGLNFTADNTIVAQKDRIKIRAVDQAGTANQMPQPPNAALSATDKKKITDWIAAGGRLTD